MSRQEQLKQIVGKRIAQKRDEAGMTQMQVAEKLHMTEDAYARIERGVTEASLMRLSQLSKIFQCGVDELVTATSTGLTAQAKRIANMLDGISASDRDEIVTVMETICKLAHKKHLKEKKPY